MMTVSPTDTAHAPSAATEPLRRFHGSVQWAALTVAQQAEIGAMALEYAAGFLGCEVRATWELPEGVRARAMEAAWDKAGVDLIEACSQALPDAAWRDADGQAAIPACLGPICRACGCSENDACPEGCAWAAEDLCTACVERATVGGGAR